MNPNHRDKYASYIDPYEVDRLSREARNIVSKVAARSQNIYTLSTFFTFYQQKGLGGKFASCFPLLGLKRCSEDVQFYESVISNSKGQET